MNQQLMLLLQMQDIDKEVIALEKEKKKAANQKATVRSDQRGNAVKRKVYKNGRICH